VQVIRNLPKGWSKQMMAAVRNVDLEEMKMFMREMIMPVFTREMRDVVVTCGKLMTEVSVTISDWTHLKNGTATRQLTFSQGMEKPFEKMVYENGFNSWGFQQTAKISPSLLWCFVLVGYAPTAKNMFTMRSSSVTEFVGFEIDTATAAGAHQGDGSQSGELAII
jgi:hypothetical protein